MKLLTTEQQSDLQELLESLEGFGVDVQNRINYWAIELRPKRTRTPKIVLDGQKEFP